MNPHLTQAVLTWGKPVAEARGAVIALHGRSHAPADIEAVCRRIGLADFACVAPAAANGTWYPSVFMAPLADNEPALSHALERVDSLVAELAGAGVDRSRIVLLGFSQGACLASEYALRNPGRYGGLLVFTGSAIGPPGTQWPQAGGFAGTPVLLSGSMSDPWVPLEYMQRTAALFRSRGGVVRECFLEGSTHVVSDAEIAAARSLLLEPGEVR